VRAARKSEAEIREAWNAYNRERGLAEEGTQPPPAPRNVREVLDLGTTVYVSFRGRAYGVPPLPWREGQRLLAAWNEAVRMPALISPTDRSNYTRVMGDITATLWRNTRPVGLFWRVLKRLGLLRNPFASASDSELAELLGFFLASRTKHTGSVRALNHQMLPT
jgi:hypothetical protein